MTWKKAVASRKIGTKNIIFIEVYASIPLLDCIAVEVSSTDTGIRDTPHEYAHFQITTFQV